MNQLKKDVLGILKEDARYSAEKIAIMLGKDAEAVRGAIEELEAEGIIVRYSAVVDENKLGEDNVEALIEVNVTPQKNHGFDAIAEEIYRFAEVKTLYLMSGGFDFAVFVAGKSLKQVAMFVSEKLSTLDNIISTRTHFILKKYKTDGILLAGSSEESKRISIHA